METVNIHRKVGAIEMGYPQQVKRGKHGRFTHYVPLKKAIDNGFSFIIGIICMLLAVGVGYAIGVRTIISPLP